MRLRPKPTYGSSIFRKTRARVIRSSDRSENRSSATEPSRVPKASRILHKRAPFYGPTSTPVTTRFQITVNSHLNAPSHHTDDLDTSETDIQDSFKNLSNELSQLRTQFQRQQQKISTLVEGALRICLVDDYGKRWVRRRTVTSCKDVVDYVGDAMGKSGRWKRRKLQKLMSRLKAKDDDIVQKLACIIYDHICPNGRHERLYGWETMTRVKKCIEEYPLLDEQKRPIASHWGRLLGTGPPKTMKKIISEMRDILEDPQHTPFAEQSISLMALMLLSGKMYDNNIGRWPPDSLEFDCQGIIKRTTGGIFKISGGEIKSSTRQFGAGEKQLLRRFKLLFTALDLLFGDGISPPVFEAHGMIHELLVSGDKRPHYAHRTEILTSQNANIVIERKWIESIPAVFC